MQVGEEEAVDFEEIVEDDIWAINNDRVRSVQNDSRAFRPDSLNDRKESL